MVGGLVGANRNTLDSVEEELAVYLEDVGVVQGNDVTVLGVLAHHKAADKGGGAKAELGRRGVEGNANVLYILADNGAKHVCGLLVEDEGSLLRCLDILGGVADELVGIRCHKGGALKVYVKEDTVHGRTDFVVCGSVNGALDAFHKAFGGEFHGDGVFRGGLYLRVIRGREIREGRITAAPAALEG